MQKISILGGGIAALGTAFELTEEPGWQQRYEITVYTLGGVWVARVPVGEIRLIGIELKNMGFISGWGFTRMRLT